MDIPASTRSVVHDLTAGQTGPLSWPYPLLAKADLQVQRERGSGNETLVLDTDYTIVIASGGATATVTLTEGATAGDVIALIGLRQPARSTSFSDGAAFRHGDVNAELERLTIVTQELRRDVDLAVRRDVFDDSTEPTLIDASMREKYLYVDADGALVGQDGTGGIGGGLDAPVEVTEGGTGATTQAGARTNLGLGNLATKDTAGFRDITRGVATFVVESRVENAPPGGTPAAGTCYRVASTPSGAWSAYTASVDIAEADGAGGWTRLQPSEGWRLYCKAEDLESIFTGSAWTDLPSLASINAAATQRVLSITREFASGTAGSSATKGAWTALQFNTTKMNTILAANGASEDAVFSGTTGTPAAPVALGAGTYKGTGTIPFRADGTYANFISLRIRDTTNNVVLAYGYALILANGMAQPVAMRPFVLAAAATIQLEYYMPNTSGTVTIGPAASVASTVEDYGELTIEDMGSRRGATGAPGSNGANGRTILTTSGAPSSGTGADGDYAIDAAAALLYGPKAAGAWPTGVSIRGVTGATGPNTGYDFAWSTATADSYQGDGKVWANNATLGSASFLYISKVDRNGENIGTEIGTWDDSTNTTTKLVLRFWEIAAATKGAMITVTGTFTDGTTYWKIPIAGITVRDGGAPALAGVLSVMPHVVGNKGADGAGSGDVTGPASSANLEVPVLSGTGGKTLMRSGIVVYTPEAYGCVGDGSTDDTANFASALAAAISAAASAPAELVLSKVYKITSALSGSLTAGNLTVRFRPGARIVCGGTTYIALTLAGGSDTVTTTTMTASTGIYSEYIVVNSVAGFSVGDFVKVSCNTGNSVSTSDFRGMLNEITAIDTGSKILYLRYPMSFAVDHTKTNLVTRTTLGTGRLSVINPRFEMAGASGAVSGLYVTNFADPVVTGGRCNGLSGAGIFVQNCIGGLIDNYSGVGNVTAGSNSDFSGIWCTKTQFRNISSHLSGSFGQAYTAVAWTSQIDVITTNSTGRAIKWEYSCANRVVGASAINTAGTGISVAQGSSDNSFSNITAIGNGADGVWLNGGGNARNTFHQITAYANTTNDVASSNSGGLTDYGNKFIGVNYDATVTVYSDNVVLLEGNGLLNISSGKLQVPTIELGAAADTTLARLTAGEVGIEGVAIKKVGKETIWMPAVAMTARTTNGAAAGTAEMTTNKGMFATLDFDTTTQEFAQFSIRMPKAWNESTITAAFTWSHASTSTNFGVVWAIEAVAISDDDAGDVAFGTAQQVADTGGTTNDIYISAATSAVTISGSPAAEDWVLFQVKRVPADASDTMAIDARLHGVTIYFTTDASTDA